jgi:hypothetical protein
MTSKYLITKGYLINIRIIHTIIFLVGLYYIINYIVNNYNTTEHFTPKIRGLYRPYLRDARVVSEGFYGDGENNINRLFRKFGLY